MGRRFDAQLFDNLNRLSAPVVNGGRSRAITVTVERRVAHLDQIIQAREISLFVVSLPPRQPVSDCDALG